MRFLAKALIVLFTLLVVAVIAIYLWLRAQQRQESEVRSSISTIQVDSIRTSVPASAHDSIANSYHSPPLGPAAPAQSSAIGPPAPTGMIIPVVGVKAKDLVDTYTQARANGRDHDAIDIMAPHNSQIVAAAAGRIVRLFQSVRGGTTIYELNPGGDTVYYYAHLDHYADGLAEGEQVEQGQLLGYVGDTGDAGPENYHLHFAIWLIQDPKKFWDGENINPYPILRQVK